MQDNLLSGGAGSDLLHGFLGDDTLTGGSGSDDFLFFSGDGSVLVTDFENNIDELVFSGFAWGGTVADFIAAHATQVGADVVFDFGAPSGMTVLGVTLAQLHNDVILL